MISKTIKKRIAFQCKFFSQKIVEATNIQIIDYNDLLNKNLDITEKIYRGYSNEGLGIIIIRNPPKYNELRMSLLPMAKKIHELPDEVRKKLEGLESNYGDGIKRTKTMEDYEHFDLTTIYALPIFNQGKYLEPDYKGWISEIPGIREAHINMSSMLYDTSKLFIYHLEKYIKNLVPEYELGKLFRLTDRAKTYLIHYCPFDSIKSQINVVDKVGGWHCDWTELSILNSAMYLDKYGNILDQTDSPDWGLLIYKNNTIFSVTIPKDCIGIQIGECLQIHSGGKLVATPHRAYRRRIASNNGISRNQLSFFLFPDKKEVMSVPKGAKREDILKDSPPFIPTLADRWNGNEPYIDFRNKTYESYYAYYKMN
jgi:isopenicillin N synthase-like dioxygenase